MNPLQNADLRWFASFKEQPASNIVKDARGEIKEKNRKNMTNQENLAITKQIKIMTKFVN